MTVGDFINCIVTGESEEYLLEAGETGNALQLRAPPGAQFVLRVSTDPAGTKIWHAPGNRSVGLNRGPYNNGWGAEQTVTATGPMAAGGNGKHDGQCMLSRTLMVETWISSANLYACAISFNADGTFSSRGTDTLLWNDANTLASTWCVAVDDARIVCAAQGTTDSQVELVACTISGVTITGGSNTTIATGTGWPTRGDGMDMVKLATNNIVVFDPAATNHGFTYCSIRAFPIYSDA